MQVSGKIIHVSPRYLGENRLLNGTMYGCLARLIGTVDDEAKWNISLHVEEDLLSSVPSAARHPQVFPEDIAYKNSMRTL